jgi:hypothetical protein
LHWDGQTTTVKMLPYAEHAEAAVRQRTPAHRAARCKPLKALFDS